jgi:hypothetical protein
MSAPAHPIFNRSAVLLVVTRYPLKQNANLFDSVMTPSECRVYNIVKNNKVLNLTQNPQPTGPFLLGILFPFSVKRKILPWLFSSAIDVRKVFEFVPNSSTNNQLLFKSGATLELPHAQKAGENFAH